MPATTDVYIKPQPIVLYMFIKADHRKAGSIVPQARHLLPRRSANSAFSTHLEMLIIDSNHLKFQACFNIADAQAR